MNWAAILKNAGIPEPPGRPEVVQWIKDHPYSERKPKSKPKRARVAVEVETPEEAAAAAVV